MRPLTRRDALRLVAAGAGLATAGCVGDAGSADGTATETDTPRETPTPPPSSTTDARELPERDWSGESPDPAADCEPVLPDVDPPAEDDLNPDDLEGYVERVEERRYLAEEASEPEYTTVERFVRSVEPYDEGYVVLLRGSAYSDVPNYELTVEVRESAPAGVSVEPADADRFAEIQPLRLALPDDPASLDGEFRRGQAFEEITDEEYERLRAAFEGVEPCDDSRYYLEHEDGYVAVGFDESGIHATYRREGCEGATVAPSDAERFADVDVLRSVARAAYEDAGVTPPRRRRSLSEAEYERVVDAFEGMDADEDSRYYLERDGYYFAVAVTDAPIHADHAPWAAAYYVDERQVRVTTAPVTGTDPVTEVDLEDPANGRILVC